MGCFGMLLSFLRARIVPEMEGGLGDDGGQRGSTLTDEEIEKISELSNYRLPPITTTTSRQDFNKQDLFN